MNTSFNFLFFISTFLIISLQPFLSAQTTCSPLVEHSCSTTGPVIKFPFWIKGKVLTNVKNIDGQDQYDIGVCGNRYEGFELSCNNKSQSIINLPMSGDFVVQRIDYTNQAIFINDLNSCFPKKIRDFTLLYTPFEPSNYLTNYKFVNCSSNWTKDSGSSMYHPVTISCLSGKNHSVYAVNSSISTQELPSYCDEIDSSSSRWSNSRYWSSMPVFGELRLVWSDPRCDLCAAEGFGCRVSADYRVASCVSPSKSGRTGIPRTAMSIIVGVSIAVLLLILGAAGFALGRYRAYEIRNELLITITRQPVVTISTGLDERIIESYPKTELGESGRLPEPNDTTCPICLCEYQPKETLRSIPECSHYFHVNCIDEWLKLNGTCPLCRNSPENLSSFSIESSTSSMFS